MHGQTNKPMHVMINCIIISSSNLVVVVIVVVMVIVGLVAVAAVVIVAVVVVVDFSVRTCERVNQKSVSVTHTVHFQ
jgi:hypothetical protein